MKSVYVNAKLFIPGDPSTPSTGTFVWINVYEYQGVPSGQITFGHINTENANPDRLANGTADSISVSGTTAVIRGPVDFQGENATIEITLSGKQTCKWSIKRNGAVVWAGEAAYEWAGIYVQADGAQAVSLSFP